MYNFQLEEFVASLNEDYEMIMNEYSGTELFSEVIHALNWLFPDWKMNKELGESSPEFVLTIIHAVEDCYEESLQIEWLILLYDEILELYPKTKLFHKDSFEQQISNEIFNLSEDEFCDYFGKDESEMTADEIDVALASYEEDRLSLSPFSFS